MASRAETNHPSARIAAFPACRRLSAITALGALLLAGSSACTRSGAVVQTLAPDGEPEARTREAAVQPAPAESSQVPKSVPTPDLFDRGAQYDFQLGTELLRAVPQKFSRLELKTKKLALAAFTSPSNLWLAVDHHAPRLARSPQFSISELLNEDVELSPGSHYLVAFEWGAPGPQRFQLATFFVDVEPTTLPRSPGCVLVTPQLTKNGAEAKTPVRFLAVPLVSAIDRIEYRAQAGELRSRGGAPRGTEMSWKDLPAGDVALGADCFSGEEKLATDTQMVTLNPDALDPETRP